jgi:arylsulfatase A
MKRTFTLLSALLLVPLSALHAADQPNIVVILADDYGYGSAGCYGANPALVHTPHIDRLAKEGRRFTDANTTSSVCSPTRYSVITGRYCWRTSLKHEVLSTFAPLHIETTRPTVASLLKHKGYATAAVGKWHLGYGTADESPKWRTDYAAELSPGPLDIGFQYHFSVPSNHGDVTGVFVENRFVYGLRSGNIPAGMKIAGPVPDSDDFQPTYTAADTANAATAAKTLDLDAPRRKNARVMKVLTDKATAWLAQQPKEKPFFLYFAPVAVHNPVTPDQDLAGQSKAGLYGDWIHELDRSVGRILDTLDEMGVAQNTLVIFSSDNGGVSKPENDRLIQTTASKAGLQINGELRGSKHDVWEGGFKVPFLVRWPGKAEAGTVCRQMISLADIFATTAAIVGEPLPEASQAAEDSRSFLPAILGEPAKPVRDDMIVHSAEGVFAIRKGPWKWIEGVPVDDIKPAKRKLQAAQLRPQLYNTLDDPAETKDVSGQHPDVVAEMRALLNRYRDGGFSRDLPPAAAKSAVPNAGSLSSEASQASPARRVLFRQPEMAGFGDRMYVQARVPAGEFAMVGWQKNPFTPDGKLLPVGWDAGAKTGLAVTGNRPAAQRGMRDVAVATTAQMSGDAVGAFLCSADLSGGGTDAQGRPLPGSDGYKMMITPQVLFAPETAVRPFRSENSRLDLSLDLQVPVATCGEKKGSLAYVNPVLLLVDPQRGVKISYVVDLFSRRSRSNPRKVIQHIAHDGPTNSWMIQCNLVSGNPWVDIGKDSEMFQTAPWSGWRHFSCTLTRAHFVAALKALQEQEPETNTSLDPGDFQLRSFHLNAEITFETAPAELGWSMRRALLRHQE